MCFDKSVKKKKKVKRQKWQNTNRQEQFRGQELFKEHDQREAGNPWSQNPNNWGPNGRILPPACMRGPRCNYLAAGVCSYFHPGVGVQNPQGQGQGGQGGHGKRVQGDWQDAQGGQQGFQGGQQRSIGDNQENQGGLKQKACRYNEDCWRVPYCPYKHYNEDFPQLPTNQRRI